MSLVNTERRDPVTLKSPVPQPAARARSLRDYMAYYKKRYLNEIHLTRYDPASIADLGLAA